MDTIRCLVLDVDGVLTDGRLLYAGPGEPWRAFHVHDGLAIRWFQWLGGVVALLTGKSGATIEARAAELKITEVIQHSRDKGADLEQLLARLKLDPQQSAVIGDDLNDLPAMRRCGYPIAVANAAPEVKAAARYVTERPGGHGAVREAIEHLLRAAGRWDEVVAHYAAMGGAPE